MLGIFKRDREKGASLVEFALLAPFLLLLLFGTIEFAWLFSQNLDVRHGAREGARLVATNYPIGPVNPAPTTRNPAQTADIVDEICARMDISTDAEVTLEVVDVNGNDDGDVGEPARAKVDAPANTLTGIVDWAIPSSMRLVSEVEIRLEQPAGWADNTTNPGECSP